MPMATIYFFMRKNKDEIKNIFSSDFRVVNDWFYENFIVAPRKGHFMCLGKDIDDIETLRFIIKI